MAFIPALLVGAHAIAEPLRFNRDIRPILSENCFFCHGQDASRREAKLRLDERESVTRVRGDHAVIVPGRPEQSELVQRITSKFDDERMPPPDSHRSLTPGQIALLNRWIAEGASYEKHWAFLPPRRETMPPVRASGWPRNEIDRFVLARLEREELAPSREATPENWLRRVTLDLTGLPPTPPEIDAFVADAGRRGEPAYGAVVDRLLASPHHGERMAMEWLDAARYADTHGFNNDSSRTMWRWRDWVIEAFNRNLPYDRFITEQIAGDLLPQPTLEQRIATGFSRNHVINSEGGIIDEEYRVEYVADRVRTTSLAWLGLTLECARCHDHKFDPIRQRDYYRLFAFFNSVPEQGEDGRVANAVPMIAAPTREQQEQLAGGERELAALDRDLQAARAAWRWREGDGAPVEALATAARQQIRAEPGVALTEDFAREKGVTDCAWRPDASKPPPTIAAAKIDFGSKTGMTLAFWLRPDTDNPRDVALFSGLDHRGSPADAAYGRSNELRLIDGEIELRLSERLPVYAIILRTEGAALRPGEWHHVAVATEGGKTAAGIRVFVDGAEIPTKILRDGLPNHHVPKKGYQLGADNTPGGARWRGVLDQACSFPKSLPAASIRALFHSVALPFALAQKAHAPGDAITQGWLREAVLADDATTRARWEQRTALWESHLALRRSQPTAMIMVELPQPRPTFVLNRGQYDQPGERVDPGVPEELIAAWPAGAPRNRLGFARWLTQREHPLTARVTVNRIWAQLFGTGLVKTLEDFGSQGEWPSHPELLDWLARELVENGWNVKALLKRVVLSATYRQSSAVTPTLQARDPENRLFARGPRFRLPAETIRDQALAVSGLLAPAIGGPSVYPYQPDKLYQTMVVGADYPGTKWLQSTGADLHRRSMYTFWKRTVPHPAMITFDAPDREFCQVRRARTNTPLQALVLWNEPGYVEASRLLGTRLLREGGADDGARVAFAFRLVLGRQPSAAENRVLTGSLQRMRADFARDGDAAAALVKVGEAPADPALPAVELAAATAVANVILNLDEAITKN